jgi:flagellar biosynthesis anti-sigma factor FlgM
MRVDLTTVGSEPAEQNKMGRAGQTAAAETAATGVPSSATSGLDQTRFSFDQTRIQSLEAQVLAQPEIRADKVQSLRQAIGNGQYSVPASQVADAMTAELSAAQG